MRFFSPLRTAAVAGLALLVLPACDSGEPEPTGDSIAFGINYTRLFAPATDAEVAAVRAEWAARNPTSSPPTVVGTATEGGATITVVSHTVTAAGCETVTHYAAVRVPDGLSGEAPMLVVHHGGDDGFRVGGSGDTGLTALAALYPDLFAATVQVMPVYRSEPLDASAIGLGTLTATGAPSPWDCDVDDAIATVDAVIGAFPGVVSATERVAMGFSRGGNTAALHAARDPEMDALVDYYGPTDFYNDAVQLLTTGVLTGNAGALGLPGAQYLLDNVLLPLRNADGTYNAGADYATARLAIVRRSASVFAASLPETQVHHHRQDNTVPVGFTEAFVTEVAARGAADRVEVFYYGSGTPAAGFHTPTAMPESLGRVQTFLLGELAGFATLATN